MLFSVDFEERFATRVFRNKATDIRKGAASSSTVALNQLDWNVDSQVVIFYILRELL